jgi:hypothetical protein
VLRVQVRNGAALLALRARSSAQLAAFGERRSIRKLQRFCWQRPKTASERFLFAMCAGHLWTVD